MGAFLIGWDLPDELFLVQVACSASGFGVMSAGRAHAERSLRDAAPSLTFVAVWLVAIYLAVLVDLDFVDSDFYPTASQVLAAALIGLVIEAALVPGGRTGRSSYRMQGIIFIGLGLASALIALIPAEGSFFEVLVESVLFATVLAGLSASLVAILLLAQSLPGGKRTTT